MFKVFLPQCCELEEVCITPYKSVSPLTGTVEIALLEYMCMEFDPSLCILRFNKHQICAISNRKTPGTIYRPAPFPWSMPCYVFILSGMTASADLPACFRNMHALFKIGRWCLRNNFLVSLAKEKKRERSVLPLSFVAFFFERIAQDGANFIE